MICKLCDIADVKMGQSPSGKDLNSDGNGIPFLQGRKTFGRIYPTIDTWTTNPKKIGKKDSILLSLRAPVGDINVADQDICIGRGLCSIEPKKNCLQEYLYYLLLFNSRQLRSKATGTTFEGVNRDDINNLNVEVPDLETQKKIVRILSALDQKIELNNLQNSTLFDSIKSIFKNKYYQKGNGCSLSDYILTEVNGDWGKDKKEDGTKEAYCIRGADIPDMEYGNKGNAPSRYILEKRLEKKSLSEDDIIIEISGGSPTQSTGRTAYITKKILSMYDTRLLCTNFCKAIKVKDKVFAPFVYMYLKLLYEDGVMFNWENGTTGIKNLALSSLLSNMKVQSLNKDEARRFYDLFHSVIDKISGNSAENIILAQIRDTLLPKLMSGEIKLNGAV